MDSIPLLVQQAETYQDYIDHFITFKDVKYLNNINACRELVRNNFRSKMPILTYFEFMALKEEMEKIIQPKSISALFFSEYQKNKKIVILNELAYREVNNVQKIFSTIIYVQHQKKGGREVTSYIDYTDSLKNCLHRKSNYINWKAVFEGTAPIVPHTTDLSYFDVHTHQVVYNETDNYSIMHDPDLGLVFQHKGDHKRISMHMKDPQFQGNIIQSPVYITEKGFILFYDHIIRKKN